MPHQPTPNDAPEHRDDETTNPSNPPNAVVQPEVRRAAVWLYVGILVAFFVVVGGAFLLLTSTGLAPGAAGDGVDPNAVGTSGERMPREGSPGGFDPTPTPGSTRDELESRGAGEPPQGPMAGLSGLRSQSGDQSIGRTIELKNVEVERAEGSTFWIRDGNERASVVTAGGMPTVHPGQRVDLRGTIEATGQETRIRATRIDVR
jgi:hypothetical protein